MRKLCHDSADEGAGAGSALAADFTKRVRFLKKVKDMAELVKGLRTHVDDLPATLAACQALARLLEGEMPKHGAAVAKAGGIEAVLAAVAKHSGSAQVAEHVCSVLQNLAYYSDENEAAVAAAGGIEAVVRVLGEHQANTAVMEEACWALHNIGGSERLLNRSLIALLDGHPKAIPL